MLFSRLLVIVNNLMTLYIIDFAIDMKVTIMLLKCLCAPQLKSFHNELLSELEKKVELDARYLTVSI